LIASPVISKFLDALSLLKGVLSNPLELNKLTDEFKIFFFILKVIELEYKKSPSPRLDLLGSSTAYFHQFQKSKNRE
jgi:hypothetical protein